MENIGTLQESLAMVNSNQQFNVKSKTKLEMWANAQRDGRPAEHRRALCSTPQSLADPQCWSAVQ